MNVSFFRHIEFRLRNLLNRITNLQITKGTICFCLEIVFNFHFFLSFPGQIQLVVIGGWWLVAVAKLNLTQTFCIIIINNNSSNKFKICCFFIWILKPCSEASLPKFNLPNDNFFPCDTDHYKYIGYRSSLSDFFFGLA